MGKKAVCGIIVTLLLTCTSTFAFNIKMVEAQGTIYIRADGSIDPPTANITTTDKVIYTFTNNNYDPIVVERNNIVIDGAGYMLQGIDSNYGITLAGRTNVTVQNMLIRNFVWGIFLNEASHNSITRNTITANTYWGITSLGSSDYNRITGNTVDANGHQGMRLDGSHNSITGNIISGNPDFGISFGASVNNTISGNNVTGNGGWGIYAGASSNSTISRNSATGNSYGITLGNGCFDNRVYQNNVTANSWHGIVVGGSFNNSISENTVEGNTHYGIWLRDSSSNVINANEVTGSTYYGIWLNSSNYNEFSGNDVEGNGCGAWLNCSSNNRFFHNSFNNNSQQANIFLSGYANVWDDGYPSGGNYWSDYTGVDDDHDGIGDTQYIIDTDNRDRFPITNYGSITEVGSNSTAFPAVNLEVTFNNVVSAGLTVVNETSAGPQNYQINGSRIGPFFDIFTSATYSGMVTIVIEYYDPWTGLHPEKEAALRLMGFDDSSNTWVDITAAVNTTSNMIYGQTVHLSIFGVTSIFGITGDTNFDGTVNVLDLILIAAHLGHVNGDNHPPNSANWNKCMNTDLNDDGKHNVLDLIVCANHLGQHWP